MSSEVNTTHMKIRVDTLQAMKKLAIERNIFLIQAFEEAMSDYLLKNKRFMKEFKAV